MLGLHGNSVVSADTLAELLWGARPPRTSVKALQTHISALRRALGDGFVLTEGSGWTLNTTEIDAIRYTLAARQGRDAIAAGDAAQAVARFDEALTLWRGTPELPDGPRATSEKTRWIEGHAALVEDRADALLATGRAAEIVGELEAAIADAPLRERRWGQLMLALYRAGRQGEALAAYQRARSLLVDELGVDPGPNLRRLEAAIVAQDAALEIPVSQQLSTVTKAVTFLLTDIEGSTAAWEAQADAMAVALARHDEIVEQVVTARGGRLVKTRGEGDATFSVFDRPSSAAAAAIELQEAIRHEPWALASPMRIRVSLHTGEVELRDGDYFGRAVNRAARLRSLAAGGQILCSGATAELVIDTLADDVVLADLGMRQLKNLARPEHVFELRLEKADDSSAPEPESPMQRPSLPAVLTGPGPFVGRGEELAGLLTAWQATLTVGTRAVLVAGEPGVGKTRLAGEWSRQVYEEGAIVLYGRCDEDLGAAYQPFAEALRSLMPCLGADRLRGLRGVESLLPLVPGLTDVVPDLPTPSRSDPDTERYALFDAVVALLGAASSSAPVVLILDDLHWAAKPTLLLLRHLLRFGEHARVQIVGTYRSTDLDRSHPLAAMLTDLHRDGTATRLALTGLDEKDVSAYVAEAGYDDEELARALASVTGGNPFFLIEALRHVDESGGRWDPNTLPQGVREAVSRRLSRLPAETNRALAAAAVVGSRFAVDLVERVVDGDLVDAFDEACKAGIVIEEPGGRYRFNHALVRQSLLAELPSVRRMRLHQRIAVTLEAESGAEDELLAELAYHYFECAWAGNAVKAVEYCRRAADQAMARLAYEGAADLYDRALHALEEIDDELPDRDALEAELLVARCEALLAAGDVGSAAGAVAQLQQAAGDSVRLAAWGTCFDGELSMLTNPERLDEIEAAVGAAAEKLAGLEDAAGEAKAHTVRAGCLTRLGRIGDAETALDQALTAARRAHDHRRVNAVLAGAPLAALWGPNPVPRAGGRCLDVVRLLRITTGSPVVEATSTRCQGVLDALRGRASAGRALIDSARRSLTELGMRHALLEVEQFAGLVELVANEPAAAEPLLRRACDGFRRMGLDADTAETAAFLARACLALDRDTEADELCIESERLAGHALKPSITWRTVRAQLLARSGAHAEARRVAEEAVSIAERTDALVDHGDACLTLAMVLDIAGDVVAAQAAAEQAVALFERKGAAALAELARGIVGAEASATVSTPEEPAVEPDNECVRTLRRVEEAVSRGWWSEVEQAHAPIGSIESRRKIVGFERIDLPAEKMASGADRFIRDMRAVRTSRPILAIRGERLALTRTVVGTADDSPGAPADEMLQLLGLDEQGRIALQIWFDVDDMDAAIAELDAQHAGSQQDTACVRLIRQLDATYDRDAWEELAQSIAPVVSVESRRKIVGVLRVDNSQSEWLNAAKDYRKIVAQVRYRHTVVAVRGERLALTSLEVGTKDQTPGAPRDALLQLYGLDEAGRLALHIHFDVDDVDDVDAAMAELDARYLVGEAAPHAPVWRTAMDTLAEANRHEPGPILSRLRYVDHRRISFGSANFNRAVEELWRLVPDAKYSATQVHALNAYGVVATLAIESADSADLQWSRIVVLLPGQWRMEVYDDVDLNAALARFEELSRPALQLENAASRVDRRINDFVEERSWDRVAALFDDNLQLTDRRRGLSSDGAGREAAVAELRIIADLGVTTISSEVIAIRGDRLALVRSRYSGRDDKEADGFHTQTLRAVEVGLNGLVAQHTMFDVDDLDAAVAELDTRYLAGDASSYADTWSAITKAYGLFNRHEVPPTTSDWVNIDHRRGIAFAPGDQIPYMHATFDVAANVYFYVETVHRLSPLGALVTQAGRGTSRDGGDAEWREVVILAVDGDLLSRCEIFEEADLDAALARFDELSRQASRLENAAARVCDRFKTYFAERDWDSMTSLIAEGFCYDDRRRVVGVGVRLGRDAHISNLQAIADVQIANVAFPVVATRGDRLILARSRYLAPDSGPQTFLAEALEIIEIDGDERVVRVVSFDPDDLDAAFSELDTRYLAGEAAVHAHTWSVVAGVFEALNHHETPAATPDLVTIDHRRGTPLAHSDLKAIVKTLNELTPDLSSYVEEVHRLRDNAALVMQVSRGTSEGFDAEWRILNLLTFDGDMVSRCELFDEVDIGAALARFDELIVPSPRLENAASRVFERMQHCFSARDWDGMAGILAEHCYGHDRRRVVNVDLVGRRALIESLRSAADLGGVPHATLETVAIRAKRLVLTRTGYSLGDEERNLVQVDQLQVVEIDAEGRVAAIVTFDTSDIDAAFDELDARYAGGEAAAHAHTWSIITEGYAALNRHELPPTTPDFINVDHRRGGSTFAEGDLLAYVSSSWNDTPDNKIRVEAVHRLTDLGAVVSTATQGSTVEDFAAEWSEIGVVTVAGDMIRRTELFDVTDLNAALAKFDELSRSTHRLENAATQMFERILADFRARDWDAMAGNLSVEYSQHDRRRVVNAGILRGRDAEIASFWSAADLGITHFSTSVVAIRGERVGLVCARAWGRDQEPEAFISENFFVVEINADNRAVAAVVFDPDAIDAAFDELDARYVAGEAAAYARTYSVIAGAFAAVNRRELPPTTSDLVSVDHRRPVAFAPGELIPYLQATLNDAPEIRIDISEVHRLSSHGAVVSHMWHNTSHEGFDAEWRVVGISTVDGELINRCELFDEDDLATALARFDELCGPATCPENAASRAYDNFVASYRARDWAAMAKLVTADICHIDRRRVANAGTQRGRDAMLMHMRSVAEVGARNIEPTFIATRGNRLALARQRVSGDKSPEAFGIDVLIVVEVDANDLITGGVAFDLDDLEAALAELDARYLAGEAAAKERTWSPIVKACAALNQQEFPATATGFTYADRRRIANIGSGDMQEFFRAAWELTPNMVTFVETVHRLGDLGAVVTQTAQGNSDDGFYAEWRVVNVYTVEGDLLSRCEVFDEVDLELALARFDELSASMAHLQNTASQASERLWMAFAKRDWDELANVMAEDIVAHDRRRIVNAETRYGREVQLSDLRAAIDVGAQNLTSAVIATRGENLALSRLRFSNGGLEADEFAADILGLVEVDADRRIAVHVAFDADDIDAAFAELDARYIAGEAAAHADTWTVVAETYAGLNRHELAPTPPDWAYIDHHRLALWHGDFIANMRAAWEVLPDWRIRIVAIHRLTHAGAVLTAVACGTSRDGFEAEQPGIALVAVRDGMINRFEYFEDTDLDFALARFDDVSRPAPLLKNAASQVGERFRAAYAARDWDTMAQMTAVDFYNEDRRSVVNGGIRRGRDSFMEDMRSAADLGIPEFAVVEIAIRGERLALCRAESNYGLQDNAFYVENFVVAEIDAEQRMSAQVMFDVDDIEGAFRELDARYIAGEAAAAAETWSVISETYAALNRYKIYPTTDDLVSIDHRRVAPFAPGDLIAYLRAAWIQMPDLTFRIDVVHRLNNLGAVFTEVLKGTTEDGFVAEWRLVEIMIVEGDRIKRAELFDEGDFEAALARFDQLSRRVPGLENRATRIWTLLADAYHRRDVDGFADLVDPVGHYDDRRRGLRVSAHGSMRRSVVQALLEFPRSWQMELEHVAVRGSWLSLSRQFYRDSDQSDCPITVEVLTLTECSESNLARTLVLFDPDDYDAAFAELDARYVAGEAAGHVNVWSAITRTYAGLNRREIPEEIRDAIHVDHRTIVTIESRDMAETIRTAWGLLPDLRMHVESVYRLSAVGAVVTSRSRGTSKDGFDAEWRMIHVIAVDGGRISRLELFDESALDAALARFDELNHQARPLDNAATRARALVADRYNNRDLEGFLALAAGRFEDHRKGLRNKGAADEQFARAVMTGTPESWHLYSEPVAIRGDRLSLSREKFVDADEVGQPVTVELVTLTEVGYRERPHFTVFFDPDDIDSALRELDARYVAGEAAAYADTWSAITRDFASFENHERPTDTFEWVDHRSVIGSGSSDLTETILVAWDMTLDVQVRIEAVHRLNDGGAVITHSVQGTSRDGFDFELRMVDVFMIQGGHISRCESFDESDLDAALARFDELSADTRPRNNVVARVLGRVVDAFDRRDPDRYLALFAEDCRYEDRRKGLRDAGSIRPDHAQTVTFGADAGWQAEFENIAVRGEHLILGRATFRDQSEVGSPIAVEALNVGSVTDDELISWFAVFDPDDIDAAFAELDARWIASGEVAHPEVIHTVRLLTEAANRHEWDALATRYAGATYANHRQLRSGAETVAEDLSSLRMLTSLVPDLRFEASEILQHSAKGVVIHTLARGTSTEDVPIELPLIVLMLIDGDRVTHAETYDLNQRDQALARFDELNTPG